MLDYLRFADQLGRLRSLEAVPVYAQLPYFGFERLSGNAQFNGGTGWPSNHAFRFPESGFEDFSFMLDKVSNQWSNRRSRFGSHVREPGLIYKEGLPFTQNHRPLDYILQLADIARPIVCVEEFDRFLVYVSNLLAQFFWRTVRSSIRPTRKYHQYARAKPAVESEKR